MWFLNKEKKNDNRRNKIEIVGSFQLIWNDLNFITRSDEGRKNTNESITDIELVYILLYEIINQGRLSNLASQLLLFS